jgi:predicted nucleic acid-binding protein
MHLAEPVSRDPDDDKFLACALAASAPVVVSGDRDLQTLGSWQGVRVLSPRAFADEYLTRGGT